MHVAQTKFNLRLTFVVPTNLVDQNIVSVTINVANRIVSCQLLDSFPDTTPFICSITYGPSPDNCEMFTNSSMLQTGHPGGTVTVNLVEDVISGTVYCYTVSVSYGSDALIIDGNFSSSEWPHIISIVMSHTNNYTVCFVIYLHTKASLLYSMRSCEVGIRRHYH